jgi:SAM-dependent methyltransferase
MAGARYDGLAKAYDAFVDVDSPFNRVCAEALRRLLGPGDGRCLDVGCGGGHRLTSAIELGWTVVGVDASADQLRVARERLPDVELVHADATALPFADESFDAAFSTFTHTDFDDFAAAMAEARRILRPRGRFVYVGNHPCFVGATQEHRETGLPRLYPGYRNAGPWRATDAPGTTPDGWRAQLGSFVHVPLAAFLNAYSGFVIDEVAELDDGWEYPKTIALAFTRP